MSAPFPRKPDGLPHAWGLTGKTPRTVWERFSPEYEAQAERLWRVIEAQGLRPELGGAGSEDGEYICAVDEAGEYCLLIHLEDPQEAGALAQLDDAALAVWLAEQVDKA